MLAAVNELVSDTWTTKRSAVKAGDRAATWIAQSGKQRGVVAMAEVLNDPVEKRASIHSRRYWRVPLPAAAEPRVDIRYVVPPSATLWLDDDKEGILEVLSVASARGGSVFSIEPAQWAALVADLGGWPEAIEGAGTAAHSPHGAGFLSVAVDQHAMDRAREHYRALGYAVETHGKPFDLLCTRSTESSTWRLKGGAWSSQVLQAEHQQFPVWVRRELGG